MSAVGPISTSPSMRRVACVGVRYGGEVHDSRVRGVQRFDRAGVGLDAGELGAGDAAQAAHAVARSSPLELGKTRELVRRRGEDHLAAPLVRDLPAGAI